MKRLLWSVLLISTLSGCATPVVIDNGSQFRVFTPCTNDTLCLRDTYNVAWDNWCPDVERDYPVSYRTKQSILNSNRTEFIMIRSPFVKEQIDEGGVR